MRFDIHTNLGVFPSSSVANSTVQHCSVQELAAHLTKYNITHHMCLYERDSYHLLEELAALKPDVKHYGVQCVFGSDSAKPTDVDTLVLDAADPSKTLCVGVKFHSHRGWWYRKPVSQKDGDTVVIDSKLEEIATLEGTVYKKKNHSKLLLPGIDYYNSREVHTILKQLPKGAICSFHTQGAPSPNVSYSSPLALAGLASKYPQLKFVINHAGDYGVTNPKPSYMKDYKTGIYTGYMDTLLSYCQSRSAFHASVEFANHFHNIYLDASNFVKQKGEILSDTKKWCIGTDIPFGSPSIHSFDNEYKKFSSVMPEQQVIDAMHNTLDWFEKDVDLLLKEMAAEQNMKSQRLEDGSKI